MHIETEHVMLVEKEDWQMVGEWRDTMYGPKNSDFSENRLAICVSQYPAFRPCPFGSQLHKKTISP